jgi:hypothetical protein
MKEERKEIRIWEKGRVFMGVMEWEVDGANSELETRRKIYVHVEMCVDREMRSNACRLLSCKRSICQSDRSSGGKEKEKRNV